MSRAAFFGQIPAEAAKALEAYFPLIDALAPQWCSRVWVMWSSECETESCKACTVTRYEYRYGSVTLHGKWLDDDEVTRREAIIHEVMHLYVAPLSGFTRYVIHSFTENESDKRLRDVSVEQCREYQESVVQDLALLMMKVRV